MQVETYGVGQENSLETPIMLLPLRIEIPVEALYKKGKENEASIHNLDTLILNFSKLTLPQIYSIQQDTTTEITIQENVVAYQAAKATGKARE